MSVANELEISRCKVGSLSGIEESLRSRVSKERIREIKPDGFLNRCCDESDVDFANAI